MLGGQIPLFFRGLNMKHTIIKDEEINLEIINEASLAIAEIIQQYGDMYLPIFIRLLKEAEEYKNRQSYKEIALQMLSNRS